MTGSATESNKSRRTTNQRAGTSSGATTGLMLVALLHAGALAWALGQPGAFPAPMRLPFGAAIAATATGALLVVFLIAAFARRQALAFVVVPAMLVAGVCAHAASTVGDDPGNQPPVVVGVLGFGELSISICLSFAAAAIAARVGSNWRQVRLGQSPAFRLGALSLVVVLGVTTISEQLAPLAGLCAAVSIAVLGTLVDAVEREEPGGPATAELVSGIALSLGAIWTASVLAGISSFAGDPDNWDAAQSAMRFAWLAAMPVVLAALVALLPRIKSIGLGVKRNRSTVLATSIGVLTCIGLGQVMLSQAAAVPSKPEAAPPAIPTAPPPPVASQAPSRYVPAAPSSAPVPSASGDADSPNVAPAAEAGDVLTVSEHVEQTRISAKIKVNGPMLPKDVKQGVAKTFKALVNCYEKSDLRGDPFELRLGVLIDDVGSVKQAEPANVPDPNAKHLTCMALAFYRSGFSAPAKLTWLDVDLTFMPKPRPPVPRQP